MAAGRYGDESGTVPMKDWQIEVPFDSADYLDGSPPRYEGEPHPSDPVQEADMSAVEEAVREVIEEASGRDAAASRLRWIRWERAHGSYALKGGASRGIEPRHLQELPTGQKLRLPSGNEIHRNANGSFDVHMKSDGVTAKGKTAAQAAKQAQAVEADHKAGTPKVIEKSAKAGMSKIKLGGQEHIVGDNGRMLHTPKDTSAPGIVHRPATGDYHVSSMLPKGAMVKGSKVHFPGDPGHKTEAQVKAQNDPVRKAWKEGKTPSGAALPAGIHHVDNLPTGAKAKPVVDGNGKTSEHNPVYTKHPDGSMRTDKGVKAADPSGYLWKHHGEATTAGAKELSGMSKGETRTIGGVKVERHSSGDFTVHHPASSPRGMNAGGKVAPDANLASPQVAADSLASARKSGVKRVASPRTHSVMQAATVEEAVRESLGIQEAADSMRKASTPEPFSASKTSNWVARAGGLPAYIQHIAHDLMEKRGKSESNAIQMAIGIVKRWARGGGKVDDNTRAAAAKAVAEWEALKAKNKAKVHEAELAIMEAWFNEDDPELIQEAERYERDSELRASLILEAATVPDAEDAKDGGKDEKREDGLKVKCPKCNARAVPKGGKCPSCGNDVSKLAAFAKRLKGKAKVSEADELTAAIRGGLET